MLRMDRSVTFEREFFHLAGWMLACRLEVMGGIIEGLNWPKSDLAFSLLGYLDHTGEMEMLCKEALSTGTRQARCEGRRTPDV